MFGKLALNADYVIVAVATVAASNQDKKGIDTRHTIRMRCMRFISIITIIFLTMNQYIFVMPCDSFYWHTAKAIEQKNRIFILAVYV